MGTTAASLIAAGNAAAKEYQGLGTGYGNSSGGFNISRYLVPPRASFSNNF